MDPKHFPLEPSKLWAKTDPADNVLAVAKRMKRLQDADADRRARGLPEPVFLREDT